MRCGPDSGSLGTTTTDAGAALPLLSALRTAFIRLNAFEVVLIDHPRHVFVLHLPVSIEPHGRRIRTMTG